jgi:hypothetical protein
MKSIGDSPGGLGVPEAVLTPTVPLIHALDLNRAGDLALHDDIGAGIALVTWRANYDTSDHHLHNARIAGSGIVIRPDLLPRLVRLAGKPLWVRDIVVASQELAFIPAPQAP